MNDIFKCVSRRSEEISDDIIDGLKISYESANKEAQHMVTLAKTFKYYNKKGYCQLPFCHTLEAESFGSEIIYDYKRGNRVSKYAIEDGKSIEDNITQLNFDVGRISETLKAISILKEVGENLILNITGPFSIASSIMPDKIFYRLIRNDPKKTEYILATLEEAIIRFILEGVKRNVDLISFADPTGTVDIVGPRVYKEIAGKSTYKILKEVEDKLSQTVIHLCGKTSTSLEYIGLLEQERIAEQEGADYFTRIKALKNKRGDVSFVGHWCLKMAKKDHEIIKCKLK